MKITKAEHAALLLSFKAAMATAVTKKVEKGQSQTGIKEIDELTPADVSLTKYLRGGLFGNWHDADAEKALFKALGQDEGTRGGFFAPAVLSTELIERLKAKTVIDRMPGVRSIILETDKLEMNRIAAGPTVSWGTENAQISEDTGIRFGQASLELHKAQCLYKMSRELLENANRSVDGIVKDEITDEMALAKDKAILQGTGGTQPQGIYSNPRVLSTDLSGVVSFDDILDAMYQIELQQGEITGWVGHPRTKNTLRQLKDGHGRYIYSEVGPGKATMPDLYGAPFGNTTQIAITGRPASNESYMVGAQWNQLLVGVKPGLRIETTTEGGDAFEYDQVWIKVVMFVGSLLRHPEVFCVVKGIQA